MVAESSISVREVRQLTDRLFAKLEKIGVDQVPITSTQYWTVFPADAFAKEASALVTGDVLDDILDLRTEANAGDQSNQHVTSFWHAFHHLSSLAGFLAAADIDGNLGPRIDEVRL